VVNTLDSRLDFVVLGQGQDIAYPDMCVQMSLSTLLGTFDR